jgi:hypothetical protein
MRLPGAAPCRRMSLVLLVLAAALPAGAGSQYFVDPVHGSDTSPGTQAAPWRTVDHALDSIGQHPEEWPGLVLKLRANALYPPLVLPPTLHGTPEQPMVIEPYDGERVVFDGGEPSLRDPGGWERVPDQADEWRSRERFTTPPRKPLSWGQMMNTRYRLLRYARLEDMRAANESWKAVPLSDPRPAFGPLVGDPTRQIPFTYMGPGLYFAYEDDAKTIGRVHVRLSPTHVGAPGITDFAGGSPDTVPLSIAHELTLAGKIGAQDIVLRRLVFQNGGETTLSVIPAARNVTFDHCEVYGARYGMGVARDASGIKFHDSTFDGGLAPWTTRSDVKNEYDYRADGCHPVDGCHAGGAAHTHDILILHSASSSEYVRCTFRHAHDGIQIRGDDVEIRDSLFEDLNDEVLQLGRMGSNPPTPSLRNLRIHGNVIRQALNVVSFALNPLGGPVYFYRNVVDQRVPTRGYRVLPPDAPAPWVWRYGADFKDGATLEFHCYQNTFIASHEQDKSSYVSHLFYGDPAATTTYRNNIFLVLNLERSLSRVPDAGSPALSDGNLWYRYHEDPDPLVRAPLFTSDPSAYFTFEELWADFPEWERHSQYAEPQLANFSDEYFEYQVPYPNTDYRPRPTSPAVGRGVALPAGLPDDPFLGGSGPPDVGARPATAPVLAVGVDAATRFPLPGVPVASAGLDQDVVDADGDGFERVRLHGTATLDSFGTITTYAWSERGRTEATGAAPVLDLAEGDHYLRLVVTDDAGRADSDAVGVRILPTAPGENRLACPGFEESPCPWTTTTAGGVLTSPKMPLDAHSGARAFKMVQKGLPQSLRQRVLVSPGSILTVSGWLRTSSLVSAPASLTASVLDAGGAVLQTVTLASQLGTTPYTYHQAVLRAPDDAAFIEIAGALGPGLGSGTALFDDLRVRDRNLLRNGRFEVPSPRGQDDEAPGWAFVRGGRVADDAGHAHSGRHALVLGPDEEYQLVTQTIAHFPGRRYRVSGWLQTAGLGTAPTFHVRFLGAGGGNLGTRSVASSPSEGAYTFLTRDLLDADIPAGTAMLAVELRLGAVASGTAWFDDLMIEPLGEKVP